MHFAYRCPERVSGLLCVGDIPDYLSAGVFTGWFHRVYNLEWARYFTNNRACQSKVILRIISFEFKRFN